MICLVRYRPWLLLVCDAAQWLIDEAIQQLSSPAHLVSLRLIRILRQLRLQSLGHFPGFLLLPELLLG